MPGKNVDFSEENKHAEEIDNQLEVSGKDINSKKTYTAEQKMMVVEIIRHAGGRIGKREVNAARNLLQSPTITQVTMRQWWIKYRDVAPASVLKEAYGEWVTPKELVKRGIDPLLAVKREEAMSVLSGKLEQVAQAYLDQALREDKINETQSKNAMWVAAVAIDKMLKLNSVPKEIIDILPSIVDLLIKKGNEPTEFFQKLYATLLRLPNNA